MHEIWYKTFRLATINIKVANIFASFLYFLMFLNKYLYNSFFYCNSSKKLGWNLVIGLSFSVTSSIFFKLSYWYFRLRYQSWLFLFLFFLIWLFLFLLISFLGGVYIIRLWVRWQSRNFWLSFLKLLIAKLFSLR